MGDIIPVADVERMAANIAKSGLFGMKTIEQAAALMLIAQAEGRHPASAAQDYHIIQGRPALKADAMLARFLSAGGKVEWHTYDAAKVDATFSHPQGGSIRLAWTLEDAKRIGLAGKDNWKNYPRAMLRARVISEAIRTVFPGVAVGMYVPEEVQDFEPRDVTPPRTRKVEPVVEEVEEAVFEERSSDVVGPFNIHLPGGEVYSNHHTVDEYIEAYAGLVQRIHNSKQYKPAEKLRKLNDLRDANKTQRDKLTWDEQNRLSNACAPELPGESHSPKQSASAAGANGNEYSPT